MFDLLHTLFDLLHTLFDLLHTTLFFNCISMQFTAHSCSEYAVNKILYYNHLTQFTAQLHTKTETFSDFFFEK